MTIEPGYLAGFKQRSWSPDSGNPSLADAATLQRTQKPGFLLNLVEGDRQETRFLTGFFGMDRSGTVIFFISLPKNRQILFLSAEGYCAEGYDAES
ncbi:hypothetical protein AVDCRST_MAG84-3237 [uncultured Microcoleus sp.]|uniref:Uncharacterized protein n=1 Tax=uncultured Microcoleus sp. TaxID=259945 RepID=A0A6J4MGP0_9CYAN|nr:hypothetical protein AVDCRST_MAG84-3237 [uncultured Microcoleus sp.]